ncbi:hypothetical protein [Streptomyces sp900116325]
MVQLVLLVLQLLLVFHQQLLLLQQQHQLTQAADRAGEHLPPARSFG